MKKQKMFAHPYSFKGRIRRLEYALSYLLCCIYYVILDTVITVMSLLGNDSLLLFVLTCLAIIPMNWFFFAQGAKRCHDRNNSGWYQINPVYFLWMLLGDGDEYENDYGKDPKGRDLFA